MQQYIAGLLLLSGACACVLSAPQHPYTPHFPKRILLQHVTRCDNTTQVPRVHIYLLCITSRTRPALYQKDGCVIDARVYLA